MQETIAENNVARHDWAKRFLGNIIWTWLGVAASFFTGFFISPYIIRKLGDERYGIWALAFAFIDYFNFFDMGFKSAIINRISGYRATNDHDAINEVVNTSLFYFLGIASALLLATWGIAGELYRFFNITPAYQDEYTLLVRVIALGWAFAIALNVFVGGLEAFQGFKSQNHIYVLSLILRSGGIAVLLANGYGLKAMGVIVVASQFVTYVLTFLSFRRLFPQLRISVRLARWGAWKDLARYGVHAFVAQLGSMTQNQGPPVLVGHYLPEAFVGYYTLPNRLLQYVVELVTRIGSVTMPNTAELYALGRRRQIAEIGIYLNRYCFALFLPLSVFLCIYGYDLIRVWVGPVFAARAAPLLPAFIFSTSFAIAGQYNSIGILFGIAKHKTFSKALIVEAVIVLSGMAAILPYYGIVGAAWVASIGAVVNRGMFVPFLLSLSLELNWFRYMWSIYARPLLFAVPTALLGYWLKVRWIAGRNWIELLVVLGLLAVQYYALYFLLGVEREHRTLIWTWLRNRLRRPAFV